MAGQIAAVVRERGTAAQVIAQVVAEAEALCNLDIESLAALNARQGRVLDD